ncbi:phospholipase/carboxylesterase [Candidatus Kinetoplastibacterium oncopeltii TCC290E]|uniref:Phospholipase/carboxylesterase n=1 Tax=Candidatus Kinetoplastidibacterium stringomonadis TCC290E TaxID=1208920 RepID=M1LZQ5_9PROT|nr:phospholipase/carboxylesterase [Candidatus Kinetoplastibacterium oncopeltii]AGF48589.1 phospholipase/carboxylesterase [Candidatus Kinetoplastibacterium oncopeltii TCC290E]
MLINKERNLEIDIGTKPSHTIIWLHGLGANAQDSMEILNNLDINHLNIRFVCPNAPERNVSLNHGLKMQAWYDIKSNIFNGKDDISEIEESACIVNDLINKEKSIGIKASNIILGGFSQGCALALYVGLSRIEKINGIIALSGYLPIQKHLISKLNHHQELDIFVGHGTNDSVIMPSHSIEYVELLRMNGYKNIKSKYYNIEHSICADELRDVSNAIKEMTIKN